MKLTDHLLYIDITQICGIGCSFCMYSDKHKGGVNLTLTEKSKKNLKGLINDNAVKRISISGQFSKDFSNFAAYKMSFNYYIHNKLSEYDLF